jgi:hypothetical protein
VWLQGANWVLQGPWVSGCTALLQFNTRGWGGVGPAWPSLQHPHHHVGLAIHRVSAYSQCVGQAMRSSHSLAHVYDRQLQATKQWESSLGKAFNVNALVASKLALGTQADTYISRCGRMANGMGGGASRGGEGLGPSSHS